MSSADMRKIMENINFDPTDIGSSKTIATSNGDVKVSINDQHITIKRNNKLILSMTFDEAREISKVIRHVTDMAEVGK